ncbi:MAG: hypothetical protein MJ153_03310 [Clostridia bacterium]|nr:hypothetical protein [Clostridia bacterium]
MECWDKKLNRENIKEFYEYTVGMVYTAVFDMLKEPTKTEQVIIKSYLDLYQQRSTIAPGDAEFVFSDILQKNSKSMLEKYPTPSNVVFTSRNLDEFTSGFMLQKILNRIDSAGYKFVEVISSNDGKKLQATSQVKKLNELFPVTPLLVFELIIVALIIWGVSNVAITVPYRNDSDISDKAGFDDVGIQENIVSLLPYYPLNVNFPEKEGVDIEEVEKKVAETSVETTGESEALGPIIPSPEPSATQG